MEKELPKGWVLSLVKDVSNVDSGIGFPKSLQGRSKGRFPFFKVGDISQTFLRGEKYLSAANNYIDEKNITELRGKLFPEGTVVFAKIGEALRLNRRAILSEPSLIDNNVMGIIPNFGLDNKLLYYYMLTQDLSEFSAGNAVPSIRKSAVLNVVFPLPPLPEQKRMVAKLDTLFASLDNTRARLEKIPQLLKKFRQSVLTQAVTGKLTEEWRVGKELGNEFKTLEKQNMREIEIDFPSSWIARSFSSVAKIKSNLVNPNDYMEYPLITPDNIQPGKGILINKTLVSDIKPKSGKHFFTKNVIVYSKIRPNLNKVIIADFDGLCSADMYPIISDLHISYLFYFMLSDFFLSYSTTAGERSILPKINQKGLMEIPVLIPPLEEQQEIVRRVESLFAKADAIEQQYETLKQKMDALPQAILAKAFRGELVEQNPLDEPASELLKRIRAEKEKMTAKGQKKNMKRKDSVAAEPRPNYGKK